MTKDFKHSYLLNYEVERLNKLGIHKPHKILTEHHYNYYGDRGFIDLYIEIENMIDIIEVKITIDDLGETLRQCIKPMYIFQDNKKIVRTILFLLNTKENVKCILDNYDYIKSTCINIFFCNPFAKNERMKIICVFPHKPIFQSLFKMNEGGWFDEIIDNSITITEYEKRIINDN